MVREVRGRGAGPMRSRPGNEHTNNKMISERAYSVQFYLLLGVASLRRLRLKGLCPDLLGGAVVLWAQPGAADNAGALSAAATGRRKASPVRHGPAAARAGLHARITGVGWSCQRR